ncbi:MAG: Xaa-Pro peptidase family protein [Dictyoglomus thermophilum]|nr:Xaa-Pro peptidase family protein [Dictyoglomus thermophilum]MCX7720906.1 Xaa-Pro peptidase family protein [Dictyoglomus thermophilum]
MIEKIQEKLIKENIDAVWISNIVNIRYLTGFTGSTADLLVLREGGYILVDSRYWEQVNEEVKGIKPVLVDGNNNLFTFLKELEGKNSLKKLGFEASNVVYSTWAKLRELFQDVELVPLNNWVEELRIVKTEDEIENIKKALMIAEQAFENVLPLIKVGVSEKDIAIELEYQMAKLGSERPAFDTIVASGERGALPHGKASNKKLMGNEFIVFDFGAVYNGYHSDITRTVYFGNPTEEEILVYNIVLEAQKKAEEIIEEGLQCNFVDKVARDIIQENGFGNYFGHGLGHGVGLEIHELPRLSPKSDMVLKKGMVVTIEPGIYIPGKFGVRIEDMVVVDKSGSKILNKLTNDLIII